MTTFLTTLGKFGKNPLHPQIFAFSYTYANIGLSFLTVQVVDAFLHNNVASRVKLVAFLDFHRGSV